MRGPFLQLIVLGVDAERIHVDHGLTGTNRARPGLETALAAVRDGDVFVVTKLDRLAEFEADLIRMRTREGMAIAKARGRLKGRTPSFTPSYRRHLLDLVDAGGHTHTELAELFQVSRATVYREIQLRDLTSATAAGT